MALFACKTCPETQKLISYLRGQLQDLQEANLKLTQAAHKEREDLLDRIQSLTRPDALREYRRIQTSSPQSPSSGPAKPNFPGFRPDLRPPVDPTRLSRTLGSKNPAKNPVIESLDKAIENMTQLPTASER